jgi:hypothetical protein
MKEFTEHISNILHQDVVISEYEDIAALPLYLRNGNDIYNLIVQNVRCLLMRPKEKTNLTSLRKQVGRLKKLSGLDCVLWLENVRTYTKEKMLAEGIPFVVQNKQIYMPFLGISLSNNNDREMPVVKQISYSTQKLLLVAIYEKWARATLTEAANILGVSKMSVTRCFDELQSTDLGLIENIGKTRCFIWNSDRKSLWNIVRPFLRNSIVRQYRLGQRIEIVNEKLSGISAVSHYSMLSDNSYSTYAVSKAEEKAIGLAKLPKLPDEETPVQVFQVLGYSFNDNETVAIDPLSAVLSLSNEELNDPRVELAVEGILEGYLND